MNHIRADAPSLGDFEQLVLFALVRLGPDAYGASIRREIEARTKRTLSISAVYVTLERLEDKGLLHSHVGEPTPQRGGKRKRHFEVSPGGRRALQAAYRSIRRMADGLDDLLGEPA